MNAFDILCDKLRTALSKYGYVKPTETQEKSIPIILLNKNVLLIAPTGSGKTEAALFPIMSKIIEENLKGGIRALYITPLRALNRDVFRRMSEIASEVGVKLDVRHGDTPQRIRKMQALKPPQILITTPETLQAILPGRIMREHLKNVRWVVVDEIHELASDKRGAQLSLALERLRELVGKEFQRIGLSATVGSPRKVAAFLAGSKREIEVVNVLTRKQFQIIVDVVEEKSDDEKLAHELEAPKQVASKLKYIIELAGKYNSILVFTNTREMAEALASRLRMLKPPFEIRVHHGSLSKEERVEAEEKFKKGEVKILVCTSSLELGLDIGLVDFVIQYMSPRQATNLLQRVGRAGHKLWEVSNGLILASNADDILESAVLAKRAINRELEEIEIHENALDVLAHQLVGLLLDRRVIELNYALKVFRRAYPYRKLTISYLQSVASLLAEIGIIRYEAVGDGIIRIKRGRTWKYYYENLSVIPDVKRFTVIDVASRKPVGTLDEEFIAIHGRENEPFILAGRTWKIVKISEEDLKVFVEQYEDELGAIPAWIGELIPVPFEVALEVGRIRELIASGKIAAQNYPLTKRALRKAARELKEHVACGVPLPTDKVMVIEGLGNIIVVHACLGTKANRTLARLLAHEISKRLRASIRLVSDAYRIMLMLPKPVNAESIKKLIIELPKATEELAEAVKASDVYKWKLYHVAKRFGIISREAPLSKIGRALPLLEGTAADVEAMREALQDYFNIKALKRYFEKIARGEVKIEVYSGSIKEGVSTLAYQILSSTLPYDLMPPKKALATLAEVMKARLLEKEVMLICLHCADWQTIRKIKYIPSEIRCPKCGAKAVGIAHPSQRNLIKIIRRWKKGLKLKYREMDEIEKFRRTVGLIMTYGKKAIIAMSARGIGPTVAARILRKYHEDEEDFYLDILEAEKQYIRTRPYWE
ncbi:MAG: DEAD/DEAH box helicase [archaeon GB-1867-005]|nr:DEAD/DEAH box helicase [Candidatus Culexmicrobium cathedralense]